MMKRALRFNDGKSDKFWMIARENACFAVNYGKTGAIGKYQIKAFDNAESCAKEAEKLIASKLKKGYRDWADFDFDQHIYLDDAEYGLHRLTSHPNFVAHFDAGFYYDVCDEDSPFGSDEGADTLAQIEEELRQRKSFDFVAFPQELVEKSWGLHYLAPETLDDAKLQALASSDDLVLTQSLFATYAAAFAQIKITGCLSPALKQRAIAALNASERFFRFQDFPASEVRAAMIDDLERFPALDAANAA
jgi:uncharacterized protein YfeS